MEHKEKSVQELEKLNTRNLLSYFKAERQRFHRFDAKYLCGCCNEYIFGKDESQAKKKFFADKALWETYLDMIKGILHRREDVHNFKKPVKKQQRLAVRRR